MTRKKTKVTNEEVRQLVMARLRQLSPKRGISIGSEGSFTKKELIREVEKKSAIGKKMVKIEMNYLRSLKKFSRYVPKKTSDY